MTAAAIAFLVAYAWPILDPSAADGTSGRAFGLVTAAAWVAFVVDYPVTPFDPATALPVQIYMWANEAERAFVERTSGAIIVLLIFLIVMNLAAIMLRRRFERRW